jgi:malate dehydrogenase (quinone)
VRADTIAGVLLASPGASTAVSAMLGLLEQCFPDRIGAWRPALQEAIPSYGHRLSEEPALLARVRADTMQVLELTG